MFHQRVVVASGRVVADRETTRDAVTRKGSQCCQSRAWWRRAWDYRPGASVPVLHEGVVAISGSVAADREATRRVRTPHSTEHAYTCGPWVRRERPRAPVPMFDEALE